MNLIRVLILATVTCLVAISACFGTRMMFRRNPVAMSLRMGISFDQPLSSLDTAAILTANQYELIRNLYGRLLEYNSDSQLVADIPESFSTTTDEVTFVFGTNSKTVDGYTISSEDAANSLKRLIIRGKSSHGDIRRFLCPDYRLKSLSDVCPGIRTENNRLILKVVDPVFLPLLMACLESADYSIIPTSAIDEASPVFRIKDFRNTSGPYYVAEDALNGAARLQANPGNHHFSGDMPQTIQLIPTGLLGGFSALQRGEIDFLPTSQLYSGEDAEQTLTDTHFKIHETLPFRVSVIMFSPDALEEFTPDQRMFAALAVSKALAKIVPAFRARPTNQFFQALSDGSLSDPQLAEIEQWKANIGRPRFHRPMEVKTFPAFIERFREALKDYPEIRVSTTETSVLYLPKKDRPDIYFGVTDTAWTENFSLLGYNFDNSSFDLPGVDSEKWFRQYLLTPGKEDRIKMLNQLHFSLLRNASIVPTLVTPYYAVARNGWIPNQSTLSAGTALWRLRLN